MLKAGDFFFLLWSGVYVVEGKKDVREGRRRGEQGEKVLCGCSWCDCWRRSREKSLFSGLIVYLVERSCSDAL